MKNAIIIIVLLLLPLRAAGEVIIRDNFEYAVDRDTSDKSAFVSTGGWTGWKSRPRDTGAAGFTYTTTSIPGFVGAFPGTSSTRVLCSEHLPDTYGVEQSDTYLHFWGAGSGNQKIPPTFYVQFWIYFQYYGDQLSRFTAGKFIYPCGDDVSGGTCTTAHVDWLVIFREAFAGAPLESSVPAEAGHVYLWTDTQGMADYAYPGVEDANHWKLGPNQVNAATAQFQPNTWYLVRMYYDFSTNNPTHKMWRRTAAESEFTLLTDYVDGTTQYLTWTPYTTSGYFGINLMEMNYDDAWFYMDDFVIATTEADLPTYGSTPTRKLNNVTGVRVTLH